jgi:spore coat protein U-like protein
MIRTAIASAMLLAGLGLATDADAQSASDSFDVTANVVTTCRIEAPNDLDFGAYDPTTDTAATGTTTIRVRCTNGTSAPIALDDGLNGGGGDCTTRAMSDGGNALGYGLYQTTGTGTPWGCAEGTNTYTYTASNAGWNDLTVHGVVPAGQNAPVGNYSDTVTATVTF